MKALFTGIIAISILFSLSCAKTLEAHHKKKQDVTVDFTNIGSDRAVITYTGQDGQGTYVFDSQDSVVVSKKLEEGLYTLVYSLYPAPGGSCSVFYNYADGGRVPLNEGAFNTSTNPIYDVDPMEENTFDIECR